MFSVVTVRANAHLNFGQLSILIIKLCSVLIKSRYFQFLHANSRAFLLSALNDFVRFEKTEWQRVTLVSRLQNNNDLKKFSSVIFLRDLFCFASFVALVVKAFVYKVWQTGFDSQLGQAKDFKNGICCFSCFNIQHLRVVQRIKKQSVDYTPK